MFTFDITSTGISAELLSSNGTRLCALPNLPAERIDHSQTGLLTCGGHNIKGGGHSIHGGSQSRSCITLSGGQWKKNHTLALGGVRFNHAAVALPQGVLFTGGYRKDLAKNLQVTIIFFANCPLLFLATDVTNVEKFSPSPEIEPETFSNLGRCSNY